ncbi:hypothetical protein P389DRAFT_193868 [Cystobasidium minutum MCA 4210]|uniref:uncharacterized protein n=1 Tax=Cystobasidium minutum MCA 4210 TaxID=1397322 RepID=UPI0034CD7128|eukprot:jgi/Rhomi1/193868/gm1.2082_g
MTGGRAMLEASDVPPLTKPSTTRRLSLLLCSRSGLPLRPLFVLLSEPSTFETVRPRRVDGLDTITAPANGHMRQDHVSTMPSTSSAFTTQQHRQNNNGSNTSRTLNAVKDPKTIAEMLTHDIARLMEEKQQKKEETVREKEGKKEEWRQAARGGGDC